MGLATMNEILVQIMESVAGTHLNSTSQQYQMVNELLLVFGWDYFLSLETLLLWHFQPSLGNRTNFSSNIEDKEKEKKK